MPECPSCFREFDYDGMMVHDAALCRSAMRQELRLLRAEHDALADAFTKLTLPHIETAKAWEARLLTAYQAVEALRAAAKGGTNAKA